MALSVVLVEPEIPWNTGNIGRTCVAAGASLHLVGKLGFEISEKEIRRSGMDYWPKLRLFRHADFAAFEATLPADPSLIFLSTHGKRSFREAPYTTDSFLIFGKESSGLPDELRKRFIERLFRIPMRAEARSLNLSTSAGLAIYEGLRQSGLEKELKPG